MYPPIPIDASTDLDELEANIELGQHHLDTSPNRDLMEPWMIEAVNEALNQHREAVAAERLRRSK